MTLESYMWIIFSVVVIFILALDLGVFNRKAHKVSVKEALVWSAVWIGVALLFNFGLIYTHGTEKAVAFFGGYVIEKSLSVDNLFVFLMLFSYFRVSPEFQHKVLFWGIVGAVVIRGLFIFIGVELVNHFSWIMYIFGAFLIYTGFQTIFKKDEEVHPEHNFFLRMTRKILPVSKDYDKSKFFTRIDGKLFATPLLVVVIIVETTDIAFAVDSIPAIFAITRDPFIIYTSNIFAILGLRSLYFALSGIMEYFAYLHYGLGAILIFVGLKMIGEDFVHVTTNQSLAVIGGILILTIVVSLIFPPGKKEEV